MALFEDLNRAGLLAIGLQPEWQDVAAADYAGAPTSQAAGISLVNSPKAYFSVDLREEVHRRTARVVVTVADLTLTTYTVTINGTAVAYNASSALPANATALVAGIAAAINADGTVGPIVTAIADPAAPTTTILIRGDTETDYSIAIGVSGGTGTLTCNADAVSCTARQWVTAGGIVRSGSTGSTRWKTDGTFSITWRGLMWDRDYAGRGRIAVSLESIAGHASDGGSVTRNVARVMLAPSVLEASA